VASASIPMILEGVADIPSAMSSTIHQALRKEPKLRFGSMNAFARSLRGEMVAASEGGAVRRESNFNIPTRRRPWLAAAGWSVILGGAALVAYRAGLFPAIPVSPPAAPPDSGARPELLSSSEREEIRRLRKENFELRRANEILKSASVYFAKELDPDRTK